jgi:hypothetical protein
MLSVHWMSASIGRLTKNLNSTALEEAPGDEGKRKCKLEGDAEFEVDTDTEGVAVSADVEGR